MIVRHRQSLLVASLLLLAAGAAHGGGSARAGSRRVDAAPAALTNDSPPAAAASGAEEHDRDGAGDVDRKAGNIVSIGHDSTLGVAERAESVVSILGSSTSAGAAGTVVSIIGDSRATGPVAESVVAVIGRSYVDSKVNGDVVAVFGSVELGPHADVDGDVVSVIGAVHRDPAAVVHGSVQSIFSSDFGDFEWLRVWIRHCLLYGRPLSFAHGLSWAWTLALGFLTLYVGLAFLCRPAVEHCVRTFEAWPGRSMVAAIIAMLFSPVLLILLCATIIGIAAVPFVATGIFCAVLFGKAVMLAWLGGRFVGKAGGAFGHPAFAVLLGGAAVLGLYTVPILGFLVYNLLGVLGFGVVVYTLLLTVRTRQAAKVGGAESKGEDPPPAATPASDPISPAASTVPLQAAASLPRAGFWIRMAALLLDALLVGFVLSIADHGFNLQLVALAVYGAVMWKLRGSTVGGIVFDLRVVRVDGRGMGWETAIVRALGCFLSLAAAGIGFLWIVFDADSQAWHDKIAGTVVVKVPKGMPLV